MNKLFLFQMVVEEMNILTTVFLRHDNLKIIYPNCLLATKPISNYYRSPDMRDAVDFCIHIATPMEKIAMMKENITRYIYTELSYFRYLKLPKVVLVFLMSYLLLQVCRKKK